MSRLFSLTATLLLILLSGQAPAQTLKIATLAPDGTRWMEEIRQGADDIARRTDGRVTFRFYPGGIMGNDKSVLRKMRVGQLHGGALTGGGLMEIIRTARSTRCRWPSARTRKSITSAAGWTY